MGKGSRNTGGKKSATSATAKMWNVHIRRPTKMPKSVEARMRNRMKVLSRNRNEDWISPRALIGNDLLNFAIHMPGLTVGTDQRLRYRENEAISLYLASRGDAIGVNEWITNRYGPDAPSSAKGNAFEALISFIIGNTQDVPNDPCSKNLCKLARFLLADYLHWISSSAYGSPTLTQ